MKKGLKSTLIVIIVVIIVGILIANMKHNYSSKIEKRKTGEVKGDVINPEVGEDDKTPIYEAIIYTTEQKIDDYKAYIVDEDSKPDYSYFVKKFKDGDDVNKIENGEIIRVKLVKNPEEVQVSKTYIIDDKLDTKTQDDVMYNVEEDTIDISNDYNKEAQATIYDILTKIDGALYRYTFMTQAKNEDIKSTQKSTQEEKTLNKGILNKGILNKEEELYYKEYKKEKDENVLAKLEPIMIAKFYINAEIEKDYDTAYSLYIGNEIKENKISKDEYIKSTSEIKEETRDEIINELKNLENGKFVQVDDSNGYIEYGDNDHKKAFNMQKNQRDIWNINYIIY